MSLSWTIDVRTNDIHSMPLHKPKETTKINEQIKQHLQVFHMVKDCTETLSEMYSIH